MLGNRHVWGLVCYGAISYILQVLEQSGRRNLAASPLERGEADQAELLGEPDLLRLVRLDSCEQLSVAPL